MSIGSVTFSVCRPSRMASTMSGASVSRSTRLTYDSLIFSAADMTDTEGTVAKRRVDVAFLQCFDATVFAEPVMLTAEEKRLHTLLALLQHFGLILQPNFAGRQP
jgi:hypothetical protein